MIPATLALGLPLAAAWLWMRRLAGLSWAERLGAALAFGLSAPSLLFIVWREGGGSLSAYRLADPLVWIVAAAVAIYRQRRGAPAERRDRRWGDLAPVVMTSVALCAIYTPIVTEQIRAHQYGAWDAWAIWNLRARFLAVAGDEWRNGFDDALTWSHLDYPLLLSGAVARIWALRDAATPAAAAAIGMLCGAGTVLVVAGSTFRLGHPLLAAAAVALVAVPEFVQQSTWQLADIPVGFFTVLALALLAASPAGASHLGLAGAAAGMAAWTKNEGLVVAAVLPLVYVLAVGRAAGRAVALQRAVDLTVGLGPVLVIVALFKILVAPTNDLVDGMLRPGVFSYWADTGRVGFVLRQMWTGAWTWGGWGAVGPLWAVLLIAVTRRGGRLPIAPATTAAGSLLILQLATFCAVYVMTPHSVAWHIQTSWSRLVAQMWPTLVWWACMRRAPAAQIAEREASLAAGESGQSPR